MNLLVSITANEINGTNVNENAVKLSLQTLDHVVVNFVRKGVVVPVEMSTILSKLFGDLWIRGQSLFESSIHGAVVVISEFQMVTGWSLVRKLRDQVCMAHRKGQIPATCDLRPRPTAYHTASCFLQISCSLRYLNMTYKTNSRLGSLHLIAPSTESNSGDACLKVPSLEGLTFF